MTALSPGLAYEREWQARGLTPVAGLDEAGRGAWAGPVVAAAVILPVGRSDLRTALRGVRDSKLCTPYQRERLYEVVMGVATAVGVGQAGAREIEAHGIIAATRLAMQRALEALEIRPQALLIDGATMHLPTVLLPQRTLTKGEWRSLSIAAASIIAKVTRDRLLIEAGRAYPQYGFARHKGYGTALHRRALEELGPCDLHRRNFAPVRDHLEGGW